VLGIWVAFYQRPFNGFWKRLGAPFMVMGVAYMGGIAVERSLAASKLGPGLLQSFNIYGVAVLIMIASALVAIAARRLPVVVEQKVTLPQPKVEDRLFSEVVADVVLSFFRWIASLLSRAFDLGKIVLAFAGRMAGLVLGVVGSVIASGYRRYTPVSTQARLAAMAGRIANGGRRLAAWSSATVRFLRLDKLLRRLLSTYGAVRNRLVVPSA
jgi:hypothetical protein